MKRHPLLAFLLLTLVISWGLWIPMMLAAHGHVRLPIALHHLHVAGAFGPGLAALIVAGLRDGLDGMRRLFERFLIWRVGLGWFLLALGLPAGLGLMTIGLHMMFGGEAPDFTDWPLRHTALWSWFKDYSLGTLLVPLFLHQLVAGTGVSEELGWRGFALPWLQQRFDALTASALLAVIWTFWSLPLSFTGDGAPLWWAMFFLLLCSLPGSILTTWLFNNSRGSLLVTLGFNNAVKVTALLLAMPPTQPVLQLAPYWLVAVGVVAWAGAARLSRRPLDENCRAEPVRPAFVSPTPVS